MNSADERIRGAPAIPLRVDGLQGLRESIGAELGPTDWLSIEQPRINGFAEVTGDDQWIHVDPVRARNSAFGSTIAHGYLTLSLCNLLLPQMLEVQGVTMGVNYGANRIRFPEPVRVRSRVRGIGQILQCENVAGGVQATIRVTAEIEGRDKPGCVVDAVHRWLE